MADPSPPAMLSANPSNPPNVNIQQLIIPFSDILKAQAATPPNCKCATCNNPATLTCPGCGDEHSHDPNAKNTYYCNVCLGIHWQRDLKQCNEASMRRSLYRVGHLLQEIFYLLNEKVCVDAPASVDVTDDNIKFNCGPKRTFDVVDLDFDKIFLKFPSRKCKSRGVKKAILSLNGCGTAIAWMYHIGYHMLKYLACKVEEIGVIPKTDRRKVIRVNTKGDVTLSEILVHYVLKVTLGHNAGVYCLDLAGAQFGFFEAVTPWDEYVRTRVESFPEPVYSKEWNHYGGRNLIWTEGIMDLCALNFHSDNRFLESFKLCAARSLLPAMLEWEKDRGIVWLIATLDNAYKVEEKEILAAMGKALDDWLVRKRKRFELLVLRSKLQGFFDLKAFVLEPIKFPAGKTAGDIVPAKK